MPRYYKDHMGVISLAHSVPAVGLQISDGDNFFIDEKLNGLFLPVIDVALKLISVHTWKRSENSVMTRIV